MFIYKIRQTSRLIVISILFVIGSTIMFYLLGHKILVLWIRKNSFYSHHFPYSQSSCMRYDKPGTHSNLHSFHYGYYSNVLLVCLHDSDALDLQEKLFFPPFSLLLKLICEMRQPRMPIICSILFVMGHCNHVNLIRIHDIDAFLWQEKLFFLPFALLLKFICEMRQT